MTRSFGNVWPWKPLKFFFSFFFGSSNIRPVCATQGRKKERENDDMRKIKPRRCLLLAAAFSSPRVGTKMQSLGRNAINVVWCVRSTQRKDNMAQMSLRRDRRIETEKPKYLYTLRKPPSCCIQFLTVQGTVSMTTVKYTVLQCRYT